MKEGVELLMFDQILWTLFIIESVIAFLTIILTKHIEFAVKSWIVCTAILATILALKALWGNF